VARGIGKPCVVGAGAMHVDADAGCLTVGARAVRRGALLTIDGGTGSVFEGTPPLQIPAPTEAVQTLLTWAAEAGA
jgi:pyruvate,orthophosphate dikinase